MSEHPFEPPPEDTAPEDLEAILASLAQEPVTPEQSTARTAAPSLSVADLEKGLVALDKGLGALSATVGELSKGLDWAVDQLTEHPAGGPWFWKTLDAASTKALWNELGGFISWLNTRILHHISAGEVDPVPGCWFQHPDAVEQLTALMVAHKAAYLPTSTKASFELVNWFDRALWPTMRTIKSNGTFSGCMNGSHRAKTVEPYAHDEGFTGFIRLGTSVARRRGTDR